MSKKNKRKWYKLFKKLFLVVLILLPIFLIIIIICPVPSTFSISVKTELIKFETIDDNNSKIPLYNVKQLNNYNETTYQKERIDGTFEVADSTVTSIERIANGDVFITIESLSGKSVGTFYSADGDEINEQAGEFVEFYIDSIVNRVDRGETIIIPVTGKIDIGRSINYEIHGNSTAIVRSGKVTVIGKSIFGGNYFKSDSYDLNIGDQFSVKNPKSKAYGFVTINEESGMAAAYKIIGKRGSIITPGPIDDNSGYEVSTSLLSRFLNDPIIKGVLLAFAILGTMATVLPIFQEVYKRKSNKKRK